ncbi:hypothetical protein N7U66_13830 [Lacinutrix neustonica]|uniref:Uncharacterized protein n=1 Tax=Lacinutrix neustonica TaxID=2980107 RepID=A0A9E8SFZ3_9FLAO|nr:hypothetical protein [Lacinutrix neustonica]WAC01205.1 hypothetical protein N7U66_13830 [Lacinutrix neustonica]
MNLTDYNKDELNQLVFNLKEYEIDQCRIKLIHLTKSLKEQPNQKIASIQLKSVLERLDYLLFL